MLRTIPPSEFRQQEFRMMKDNFHWVEGGQLSEEMGFELHLEGFRLLGAGESGG